jgi:hypothetical protein
MADDSRRVLGDRLVAVVATGATSSVVFGTTIMPSDLEAFGALVETWHHEGLDTPLLLTPEEFRRSLDTFPLEYQAMMDRHLTIAGSPPFDGAGVAPEALRHACEVQAKGHLIHLRQGCLEAAGHDDRLARLMASSARPLQAVLANVARLMATRATNDDDLALEGARLAGLPESLIRRVLSLDDTPELASKLVPEMAAYLAAAEQLWTFVDRWSERR